MVAILVPVAAGELIDKITILEIKMVKLNDAKQTKNVKKELNYLLEVFEQQFDDDILEQLKGDLRKINEALWVIEDDLRCMERRGDFGVDFIELARSVYKKNDRRAALKKEINMLLGSEIIEEKSYQAY